MMFLLAVVVSLDGFVAAVAYGARRLRLTFLAVIMVSLSSALAVGISMYVGQYVACFFPAQITEYIGAALLLILGFYFLYQQSRPSKQAPGAAPPSINRQLIAQLHLRVFGLVVQILRDPTAADFDQSGIITWQEAWLLGIALSLDSFAVGIGAAMSGMSPQLTALMAGGVTLASLLLGWELGYRWQHATDGQWARLPAVILIGLGIINICRLSF